MWRNAGLSGRSRARKRTQNSPVIMFRKSYVSVLAHGCFRGPESFRREILQGNLALPLERMRQVPQSADGCNEFERVLLGDLELTQKYMQRVMGKSQDRRLVSRAFHAQSHLLSAGILSRSRAFFHTLRQLHDRNGQA